MELKLWEQQVFTFGIEIPFPPLPKASISWGAPGIDTINLVCPGSVFCGNPDASKNCGIKFKFPFKLPGFALALPFPPNISIPPLSIKVVFPPSVIIPIACPRYPNKTAP
jgi:hypothetical protein